MTTRTPASADASSGRSRGAVLRGWFSFPNPVNDYAARCTAALVVLLTVTTVASPDPWSVWLAAVLAVGFALRVAGGPKYSPFGRLSVHVLAPRVSSTPKLVAGPPKRFAQGIGLVVSTAALVLLIIGFAVAAKILLVVLVLAALAESALGFCLGCWIFAKLARAGLIPESVCEECNDIWNHPSMSAT